MNPEITPDRTQCRYFVSTGPAVVVVHLFGPASYLNSRPLGRFLEIEAARQVRRKVYFNLGGCTSLDSTVAGLIAKCAFDAASGHAWGRVGVVKPQARVHAVLLNLGLGHIAEFQEAMPVGTGANMESLTRYVEVTGACPPSEIFQAHEALIALDESNVERFGEVILAMRNDPGPDAASTPPASSVPGAPAAERGRIKFDTRAPFGQR